MRTVVTGGAGFIGSALVDHLLGDDHDVLVVDDFSTGRQANVAAGVPVETMSIDEPKIADVLASYRPEVVYHLAAQASVVVSVRDPVHDARMNVVGFLNVCEAAVSAGARKLVFASSGGTIYGDPPPDALPVPETFPGLPASPYGITKRVAHDYLAFYKNVHRLEFTSLALANVYGPRQDPHGEAGVVAIWTERMLSGEDCLLFGDGEQTRDFVYVADVADAFARAASRADGEIVNIGTGVQTTVNRLYDAIAASLSVDKPPNRKAPRPGELRHIALDVSKAKRVLGWEPRTSLDDGIAATTRWFASRKRTAQA
jgi:UDP-glucose 4-epimerase